MTSIAGKRDYFVLVYPFDGFKQTDWDGLIGVAVNDTDYHAFVVTNLEKTHELSLDMLGVGLVDTP